MLMGTRTLMGTVLSSVCSVFISITSVTLSFYSCLIVSLSSLCIVLLFSRKVWASFWCAFTPVVHVQEKVQPYRSVASVQYCFPFGDCREWVMLLWWLLICCLCWWWCYYFVKFLDFRRNRSIIRHRMGLHAALWADDPSTSPCLQSSWKM